MAVILKNSLEASARNLQVLGEIENRNLQSNEELLLAEEGGQIAITAQQLPSPNLLLTMLATGESLSHHTDTAAPRADTTTTSMGFLMTGSDLASNIMLHLTALTKLCRGCVSYTRDVGQQASVGTAGGPQAAPVPTFLIRDVFDALDSKDHNHPIGVPNTNAYETAIFDPLGVRKRAEDAALWAVVFQLGNPAHPKGGGVLIADKARSASAFLRMAEQLRAPDEEPRQGEERLRAFELLRSAIFQENSGREAGSLKGSSQQKARRMVEENSLRDLERKLTAGGGQALVGSRNSLSAREVGNSPGELPDFLKKRPKFLILQFVKFFAIHLISQTSCISRHVRNY